MEYLNIALTPLHDVHARINPALQDVTDMSGGILSFDKTKYVFCALLVFPLAILFRLLPNIPTLKHFIGSIIGLWMGYFVFGKDVLHHIIPSVVVYIMVRTLPRSIAHKVVFVFSLLYICCSFVLLSPHMYRMYIDYLGWTLDFTGPLMLLTIKLTFFAFDVHDMKLSQGELDKYSEPLRNYIKSSKLNHIPTPIEYFGYIFFFPNYLAGPVQTVKEYLNYMDGTTFKEFGGSIPLLSSVWASVKIFLYALVVVVGVYLKALSPIGYTATEEFLTHTIFYRLFYVWWTATLQRPQYYVAWLLAEAGNILIGIGYNGKDKDGNLKWDASSNVRVVRLETAQSLKEISENWNLSADRWLRNYVYLRVPRSLTGLAQYIAFFVSAIWHGFYPGYFFSFLGSAFVNEINRNIFRKIRPRFLRADKTEPIAYKAITMTISTFMLSYLFAPFVLLSWDATLKMYSSIYWCGHIYIAVAFVVLKYLVRAPVDKTEKKSQ